MDFTQDELDYAQLAANVYGLSPKVKSAVNNISVPTDWIALDDLGVRNDASGFMGQVYASGTGSGVVVAFAGTTEENRRDWPFGNVAALGVTSLQVMQAIDLYLRAVQIYGKENVSLTGHSLGGGLASILSVLFDAKSIVFDQAPFEASALNTKAVTAYAAYAIGRAAAYGMSPPLEIMSYAASIPFSSTMYEERRDNVTQVVMAGEVLSEWSGNIGKINGQVKVLDPESQALYGWGGTTKAVDLHSMALLTGAMGSSDFQKAIKGVKQFLPRLLQGIYERAKPSDEDHSLIELLVNNFVAGGDALGSISRKVLALDIGVLASTSFQAHAEQVTGESYDLAGAVIDMIIQDAYEALIRQVPEKLIVNDGVLTLSGAGKYFSSLEQIKAYISHVAGGRMGIAVPDSADWVIQVGDESMEFRAPDSEVKSDVVVYGMSSAKLHGGGGDDVLVTGEGADELEGGAGNDTLIGGVGFDKYLFSNGDDPGKNLDVVIDSDGNGAIVINGADLRGGARISSTSWRDSTGLYLLSFEGLLAHTLTIQSITTGDVIRVLNWSNGQLGIELGGSVPVFSGTTLSSEQDLYVPGTPGSSFEGRASFAEGPAVGLSGPGGVSVSGQEGNDGISGTNQDDVIDGGNDSDLIYGGGGNDTIFGGDGDDTIVDAAYTVSFRDLEQEIPGWDGLTEQQRLELAVAEYGGTIVAEGRGWWVARKGSEYAMWVPSQSIVEFDPNQVASGDDVIDAGAGNDAVIAGEGNDIISGGTGDDLLRGGYDSDAIYGGDDNDVIYGDDPGAQPGVDAVSDTARPFGNDVLDGGNGNDQIFGYGGADSIDGGAGNDVIWGYGPDLAAPGAEADSDDIDAGAGDDWVSGGAGADRITGGDGNDTLLGDTVGLSKTLQGDDYIDGGAGDDIIFGQGGNDLLIGGDGDDQIVGDDSEAGADFQGNDSIQAGGGSDIVWGAGGNDVIDGGSGDDIIYGDDDESRLSSQLHGNDVLYGREGNDQLIGGGGNDYLDGGEDDDILVGGAGSDELNGGTGKDELQGGRGDDKLFGGEGDDRLFGEEGDDSLNGGLGNDSLYGNDGDDALYGEDGDDTIVGGGGADIIEGGAGSDTIDGGDGDDTVFAGLGNDSIYGGSGRDILYAEDGSDIVSAADGDDEVYGGAGDDHLNGDAGNDIIKGDDGDDTLVGGAGDDLLDGGQGTNRYYFDRAHGHDEIQLTLGSQEIIGFRDGIAIQDLQFLRDGDDLLLALADSSLVRVIGYFTEGMTAYIQFADGSVLTQDQVAAGSFYRPVILGTEGADAINGTSSNERIYGLAGNDTLDGKGGDDLLNGGAGDDRFLFGTGRGHDVIEDVGAGTETIVLDADIAVGAITLTVSNHGDLVIALPGGTDTLTVSGYFKATGDPLSILFASGERWSRQQILTKLAKTTAGTYTGADLVGEEVADDTIVGSSGADSLYGKAGQDVLFGMDGNDYLYGDDANNLWAFANNSDFLYGGNGNDRLYGYFGNDYLEGGAGTDYLYGNDGNDVLIGGAGSDYLYGGVGTNTYRFATGFGVDTLSVDYAGQETARLVFDDALASQVTVTRSGNALQVRSGSDVVTIDNYASQPASVSLQFKDGTVWDWYTINALINVGTAANDTLRGTDRADVLDGKGGSDTLYGGAGNDQLFGGADNDYLYGEAGDDVLDGGAGNDQLQGGDGYDTYVLARGQGSDRVNDGTSAIRVAAGVAPADLVATLVDGGYYYQLVLSIAGSTEALTFDLDLSGSAADGVALPFDRVEFSDGTVWDAQAVRAFLAPTIILGTNTDDALLGTSGADRAYGFGGADQIVTLAGDDRVFGGAGNDQLDGGAGADILHGDADDDQLLGGDGDDTLEGGAGSDIVVGGAGRDYVFGDASFGSGSDQLDGNDVLQGGAGDDELDGGLGNDVFLFNLGDGQDVIVDGSTANNPYTNHRDPGFDVIRFGAGIALDDLDFSITYRDAVGGQDGDLVIHNRVSGDTVTVKYVLLSKGYSGGGGKLSTIDRIEFFDGATIDFTEMLARAGYVGNRINGTAGDDNLQGTAGEDILDGKGDISQDNLSGGGGSDVYLFGRNSGRDYIYDSYYGYNPVTYTWEYTPEDGIDAVRFDSDVAPSDLFVDPYYRGIGISGSSALLSKWQGIEQFQFADGTVWDQAAIHSFINTPTEGDNTIAGTEGDDNLDGLGGNDALYGYGGNDVLHGGVGDDNLYAGDGNDIMRYALGDGLDRIAGGAGYDVLEFGPGISATDFVVGRQFGELYLTLGDTGQGVVISEVYSYDPSDSTMQTGNLELLRFADGTEMSLADFVPDFHSGNPGPQEIYGSAGDDLIDGQGGDDFIHGLGGNDELRGGAGNDVLYGEAGDDLLIGGDGEDSYEINPGDGHDLIDNRNTDGSRDVAGFSYDAGDLSVNRAGSDLVVTFSGTTDSVTFQYWFDDASARVDGVWTNDAYLSADDLEALIPAGAASTASAESPAELHELVNALAGFTSSSSASLAESEDRLTVQALAYSSPSTTRLANMRVFTQLS